MVTKQRYYSDDDYEVGVTPSRFKRLGKAKQREYMLHWFHRNFEDPAQETPYNGREGGYLYIWGGPYDARDELTDEFGSLVSEELIEEIVDEVESEGIGDWAPGPHHPNHERARDEADWEQNIDDWEPKPDLDTIILNLESGQKPTYGDEGEIEHRRNVLTSLDSLSRALAMVAPPHAGIGHNNPPPDNDAPQASTVTEVRRASEAIREELNKPQPDALVVARETSLLKMAVKWFAKKIDVGVDSFVQGFGSIAGKAAAAGLVVLAYPPFSTLIADVVKYASRWLSHIILAF